MLINDTKFCSSMDNFFISFNQFLNGCFQEHMLQIFSIQLLFFLIQKRCRPGHRLYGVHSSSVQVKSNLKECLNYKSKRFFFLCRTSRKIQNYFLGYKSGVFFLFFVQQKLIAGPGFGSWPLINSRSLLLQYIFH